MRGRAGGKGSLSSRVGEGTSAANQRWADAGGALDRCIRFLVCFLLAGIPFLPALLFNGSRLALQGLGVGGVVPFPRHC